MTELQLYQFINNNNIEWHRAQNNGNPDVIIFIHEWDLKEFIEITKGYDSDDGGIEMRLSNNYLAIWMNDLCQYFGIDIEKVFIGEDSNS